MIDPNTVREAVNQIQCVGEYSPAGDAAKQVCFLRGVDPHSYVTCSYAGLMAWQGVLLEAVLIDFASKSLRGEL